MTVQYYEGIGRRKESTARVRVMSGSGKLMVNDKPAEVYFPRQGDMQKITAPLVAAGENPGALFVENLMDQNFKEKGGRFIYYRF